MIHNKKKKDIRRKIRIILILCLVTLYISTHAWANQKQYAPNTSTTQHQQSQKNGSKSNKKLVIIKQSDRLDKRVNFEPQILVGNVVLFHDGAYMYCDSAYLDEKNNTFEAFGTVRVEQGDTLFLYSSYLQYEGNIKLLKAEENVRLVNKDVTLFTDNLEYDRINDIGYYFDGGMLVDPTNELASYWGQYEPNKNLALFKDSVILTNNRFVMYTDTLVYNTDSRIASIAGPTRIDSDSATIYTTSGWYNTLTEQSLLLDQSRILNKAGNRILIGDSISYHKQEGYGEVFGNMFLQDTLKKLILTGHYGYYNELTNSAMATDSAQIIEYSQNDSLYIHADTLRLNTDSTSRQIKAYYGVRFYRPDLQGVCDSLHFNSIDSTLSLYRDPILWNGNNQLSGDTITAFFNDSTIKMVHVRNYAFSIQQKDSAHFNQLKGRDLKAYFKNKEVNHIFIEGNAESIFYPEEKDSTMIGMNQTESSYLSIDLKNRKIEKLKLWPKATGKMIPLSELLPDQGKLKNFEWFEYLRPKNKYDIFRKVTKQKQPNRQRFDIFKQK